MFTQTHTTAIRFILAGAVLAAGLTGPAFAGDAVRAATGEPVGRAIAEQGNEALRQIRDEMRQSLDETLRPQPMLLPQQRAQPQPMHTRHQAAA
ncbi:MAG: hypothetical protein ACPGJF_08830 [Sinimarinibacterium flocculans]|uniref:hypothetical protein n=1 Tax=Sinimarinibacterium flocculans TaxID=985250 RepID=UPI003C32EC2F